MIDDEKILASLISCPTVRSAAESCGISEEVIYSRLRDNSFCSRYDDLKLQLLQETIDTLQKQISLAVNVLVEVAEDDTNPSGSRVSASEAIFRNFVRLDEHSNVLRRLAALEASVLKGE